jgi:hypothetical protein
MDQRIEHFFMKLPDDKREIAFRVRDLMLGADKRITEAIKWNQLTFSFGKTDLAFIYTYPTVSYMNLGFMNATSLSDPKGLFEGTGKGMRHIKIAAMKEIPSAQVKKWAKESLKLASPKKG